MSDDCCDDPDDACHDHDWYDDDWYDDEDYGPPKEEPDCYACNDSGCPACEPHPKGCDCADCADGHVLLHELLHGERDLTEGNPSFADEPPF